MNFAPVHFRWRGPDDLDDALSGPGRHEGLELFRGALGADLVAVGGVGVEKADGVEGALLVGADQRTGPVVHAEVGGNLLGRAEVPLVIVLVVRADAPDLRLELVVEEEVGPPGDVAVRPHGDPLDRGQARQVDVLVDVKVLLQEQHGDGRVRHLRPVDKVDWRFSVLLNLIQVQPEICLVIK